ncbi:MAG: restriction endonuclease subunit S [Magnetococcales bacterium]|nr:restriction endonuclease subunit S [Magnetococcales bacterium]
MEGLKPYPAYRAARTHWLGNIPEYWEEKRGKYLFREVDERSSTGEEELLSISHTTGVTPRSQKNVTMFKAESYVGHKLARPNDIVINTMWAWMAALGVSKYTGIVSPSYGVYRPHNGQDFVPEYVDYLLRTPLMKWEYICRSTGIRSSRLRLYPDKFLEIAFPCPPREEQERMVTFLKAKEVQIRRLIRNKRCLIAMLNEQKQAIINQAVTRGLDPNAPMKATGIEWMPEVPAHWKIYKIKQIAQFNPSKSENTSTFSDEDEVVFLPMESVSTTGVIDCSQRGKIQTLRNGYTYFRRDDVVVAKITPCFENGKGAYLGELETEIGFGTTEFIVLRAQAKIDPIFLYQVTMLPAFRRDGAMAMTGAAGQQRVPGSFLKEFTFGLPSIQEQLKLLEFIGNETKRIDQPIEKAQKELALIQEYRERLIADVVTGKLDVRDVKLTTLDADETWKDEENGDDLSDEEMEPEDAEEDA